MIFECRKSTLVEVFLLVLVVYGFGFRVSGFRVMICFGAPRVVGLRDGAFLLPCRPCVLFAVVQGWQN